MKTLIQVAKGGNEIARVTVVREWKIEYRCLVLRERRLQLGDIVKGQDTD